MASIANFGSCQKHFCRHETMTSFWSQTIFQLFFQWAILTATAENTLDAVEDTYDTKTKALELKKERRPGCYEFQNINYLWYICQCCQLESTQECWREPRCRKIHSWSYTFLALREKSDQKSSHRFGIIKYAKLCADRQNGRSYTTSRTSLIWNICVFFWKN